MSASTPFIWTRLLIPSPISIDAARAALAALAGLSGQPRLVLEATGRDKVVSWKLGAQVSDTPRVLRALSSQLPDLRHERMPFTLDGLRVDTAARLRVRGDRDEPLNHDAIEATTRGVLGVLASTRKAELVFMQLILGPRHRPSRPLPSTRKATTKHQEHGFACEVRIGASTSDPARSRSLIEGVVGALRQLEAPSLRLQVSRASIHGFSEARSPLMWSNRLSLSDLVALTGWPVAAKTADQLPGVPSPHPRLLSPSKQVATSGRIIGFTPTSPRRPIAISVNASLAHFRALGPTGSGKSTLAIGLALQDIAANRSTVVIDPKGDAIDAILARVDNASLDRIVVIDARDQMPVGLNPLANPHDPDLTADALLAMFRSLYGDNWLPRTHELLQACLIALARRGDASIAMLPLMLTNNGFRRSIVGRVSKDDPIGLGAYWSFFNAISEAERQQTITPLLRRLRPILMRPSIRGIFGQRRPKFDIADVFTKRRVLLVNLAKSSVGPDAAALLGSIVNSELWTAAQSRSEQSETSRHPVMVHIDEVQDYLRLPGDLGDALATARGRGIGYSLYHQHLDQLPSALHHAIMANARSQAFFALPHGDARQIAATTRGQLVAEDFESLPAFSAYANILHGNQHPGWVSVRTEPLPPPVRDPESVRARSRATYGQSLDDIEADLLNLIEPPTSSNESFGRSRRRPSDGELS